MSEYDELARAKKRLYYQKNRAKRLAYQRKYAVDNRTEAKERIKERKKNDPEWAAKMAKYQREYWRKNKDRIMEQRKARAAKLRRMRAEIDGNH